MGIFPKDRDLTKPPESVEFRVDASFFQLRADELHMRLDQFLAAHLKWRSRSSIKSLIKDGYVQIDASTPDHRDGDGRLEVEQRPGRKLHHGSRVVVTIPEENRIQIDGETSTELEILYEDEEVVVVDKPADLVVHPSGRYFGDTLIQRVHAHYREAIESHELAPRLCHRLDKETSGIVLIGKRPLTHSAVMRQFEDRDVEKAYLAVVWGAMEADEGRVELPLAPSRTSRIRLKMAVASDGQAARTDWQVVQRRKGYSLVGCRLYTGRQHQIRVHLAAIGHAVVGDKLYGPDDALFERAADGELTAADLRRLELPRHALHNHRLVFVSPATKERVEVISPLAADLRAFVDEQPEL